MKITLKQRLGALIFELPLYIYYLCRQSIKGLPAWLFIRNRNDKISTSSNPPGISCDWQWTSDLYLPKKFPYIGQVLFNRALGTYDFSLSTTRKIDDSEPEVSFIIGHRGSARLDLLIKTIKSISQQDCAIECIVVEQDEHPSLEQHLPSWVRYVFTPIDKPGTPYSRASAFNAGAKQAASECLIFHDNDLLIPCNYASQTLMLFNRGFEFINVKRFIFYLSKRSSEEFIKKGDLHRNLEIESIMQNAEGGGSIGASKMAFSDIGGFDERFIGWGGEDNEFWERALTRNTWEFGYLPLIHLWHASQAEKLDTENSSTTKLYKKLSKRSAFERIKSLNDRSNMNGNEAQDVRT